MVAMLHDVVVVVVVGRKRPRSLPLTMLTMKKEMHVFYFYACMWFCPLAYGAPPVGAPLLKEMCESHPKVG